MRLPKRNLSNKVRSKRSERRCAINFKGMVQPASGALPVVRFKGDVITRRHLIDDKTTNRASFSINANAFRKLRREAFMNGKSPLIRIEFEDLTLCIVEEKDYLLILNDV